MTRVFCRILKNDSKDLPLEDSETHHLLHVLRVKEGETVEVFNGAGITAAGEIRIVKKNTIHLNIKNIKSFENPWNISIAFGIAKPAAMEFEIRRATELGVKDLFPVKMDHSLKMEKWNQERWQNLTVETAKQCQNNWLPTLHAPAPLNDFLKNYSGELFLCDENARDKKISSALKNSPCLVVGPEGGFSDAERKILSTRNVQNLGLGPNRLRTEIASLVGLILLKQKNGELFPP